MPATAPTNTRAKNAKSKTAKAQGKAAVRQLQLAADGYDAVTARAWSVVVKGRAHEIWEVEETIRAMRLPLFPWQSGRKPRFVRIEPVDVTGRRFLVEGGFTSPREHEDGE